ncbi:MAG: 3-deoxy-D-manno-octulosonic acid kinase [Oceanipulchritudo sp.]
MQQIDYPETSTHIIYDPQVHEGNPGELFDREQIIGSTSVQGPHASVVFVSGDPHEYAWKRYRRRGLMAHVCRQHYAWRRLCATRMWKEFAILSRLWAMGLPVPRPVAARCCYRKPLLYTGDLLTLRLEGAVNLRELLQQDILEPRIWVEVGRMIGLLHHRSVRHGDLNATNILVRPGGSVHLVDFDKTTFQKGPAIWKRHNLNRLHASLNKLAGRCEPFYFEEADWLRVLEGYALA